MFCVVSSGASWVRALGTGTSSLLCISASICNPDRHRDRLRRRRRPVWPCPTRTCRRRLTAAFPVAVIFSITPSASGSDDESKSAQQSYGLQGSPAPSSTSPRALHTEHDQPVPASGSKPDCAGISCQQGLGCPRHRVLNPSWRTLSVNWLAWSVDSPGNRPVGCRRMQMQT